MSVMETPNVNMDVKILMAPTDATALRDTVVTISTTSVLVSANKFSINVCVIVVLRVCPFENHGMLTNYFCLHKSGF